MPGPQVGYRNASARIKTSDRDARLVPPRSVHNSGIGTFPARPRGRALDGVLRSRGPVLGQCQGTEPER